MVVVDTNQQGKQRQTFRLIYDNLKEHSHITQQTHTSNNNATQQARAAIQVAKAAVKAAEAQAKKDIMNKYEQDMAVWRDECAILHANGKHGKALPPKPPHPFRGKRGKCPPLPVTDHAHLHESVVCPHHAAATTKVLVDTVEYTEDSEYADTDTDNDD